MRHYARKRQQKRRKGISSTTRAHKLSLFGKRKLASSWASSEPFWEGGRVGERGGKRRRNGASELSCYWQLAAQDLNHQNIIDNKQKISSLVTQWSVKSHTPLLNSVFHPLGITDHQSQRKLGLMNKSSTLNDCWCWWGPKIVLILNGNNLGHQRAACGQYYQGITLQYLLGILTASSRHKLVI